MTVASDAAKSGPYNGNGATTTFAYGFRIVDEAHVSVIKTDALGAETTLTIVTDYTVSGVGDPSGGSVNLVVAPAAGEKITLIRNVPFIQETDLENQGAYYAEVIERSLDLAVMQVQQVQEEVARSVKLPASADASELDNLISYIIRLNTSVDNIDIVASNIDDVNTVAGDIADVSAVALNMASVVAVNANKVNIDAAVANATNINAAVANEADIDAVAGNIANVNAVAGNALNINAVAANETNIDAVALNEGDIDTVAGSIANVTAVAGNIANVNSVAGNAANINAVVANEADIDAVALNIAAVVAVDANEANINAVNANKANIDAVAGNALNINAVAANETNIDAVALNGGDIDTVAGINADVTTVAGIASNVTAVANNALDISAVAANEADIDAVALNIADVIAVNANKANIDAAVANQVNINAVAANELDIDTVAVNMAAILAVNANEADIDAVVANQANINAVAANETDIDAVALNMAAILAVDANETNINAVAGGEAEISLVAGNIASVSSVAAIDAAVSVVAANVADVTNFADVYIGPSATDPALRNDGSALLAGDMYFNTNLKEARIYNGSEWQPVTSSPLQLRAKSFVGDGTEVNFTLDDSPSIAENVLVWLGGVRQVPGDDYSVSGTTLTFTIAPGNAVEIDTLIIGVTSELTVGDAVNITFTPAGNISAVNVQAALEELDSEKARLSGSTNDTTAGWSFTQGEDDFDTGLFGSSRHTILQPTTGKDALMLFRNNADAYGVYFGLDGSDQDFFIGGGSMGPFTKHRVWHGGNDGGLFKDNGELDSSDNLDNIPDGLAGWGGSLPTNAPFLYGTVIQSSHSFRATQLAFGDTTGEMAIRRKNSGVWQSWVDYYSASDVDTEITTAVANMAKTNVSNVWTKGQVSDAATLTDAATIAMDLSASNSFDVILGGNRTLGTPTNIPTGDHVQDVCIQIFQDATGSRVLSFSSYWQFAENVTPVLSTGAFKKDLLVGKCYSSFGVLSLVKDVI